MEIIKHQRNGEHLGRRGKGDALADPVGQMRKTAEKVGQGPVENEDSRRSTNRKLETYIIKVEGSHSSIPVTAAPKRFRDDFSRSRKTPPTDKIPMAAARITGGTRPERNE